MSLRLLGIILAVVITLQLACRMNHVDSTPVLSATANPAPVAYDDPTPDHPQPAPVFAGGGQSYRARRLARALDGLSFDSERVRLASNWDQALGQRGVDRGVEALLADGHDHAMHNRIYEAVEVFASAVLVEPTNADAYMGLAESLRWLNETDKAIAAFQSVLHLNAARVPARHSLASAQWTRGEYAKGMGEWQRVLTYDPAHGPTHRRLAIAHYYLWDNANAWAHAHKAEALGEVFPPQVRVLLEG